jgi:hypothetical protein
MQLYSINTKGIFKEKRIININNYTVFDCSGSNGITIKHKRNGRELYLATKEFFDFCMYEYEKEKEKIGVTFTYKLDKDGNKVRDEKGKLLRNYTSKEEVENYKKIALKQSYITDDDFFCLFEIYREKNENTNT